MNQKGFANIIITILIVAIVAAVGVGSYVFLNKKSLSPGPSPLQNPISTSTPISNSVQNPQTNPVNVNNPARGITFKEKQYRFELTLPQQWTGTETRKDAFLDGSAISFILQKKESEASFSIYTLFSILVSSGEEWDKKKEVLQSVSKIVEKDGNIYAYFINPKNTDIRFATQEQIKNLKSQIVNIIIPTFRFTDTFSTTSNWKIYRNEEFGFEFKYPFAWKISGGPVLDADMYSVASENHYLRMVIYEESNITLEKCTLGGNQKESERLIYRQQAKDVTIDGIAGKEIFGKDVAPKYTGMITLGILNKGTCYRLSLDGRDSDDDVQNIISTFKFTK